MTFGIRFAMGTILCFAVLEQGGSTTDSAARPPAPAFRVSAFAVGEELEYRVSYWFITLGSIRYTVTDSSKHGARTVYHAESSIESNPTLRLFTQIHLKCESEFDREGFSYWWICNDSSDKWIDHSRIQFDYANKQMYFTRAHFLPSGDREELGTDTVAVSGPSNDGVSLLYYARARGHQQAEERVPAFLDKREVSLYLNFLNERERTGIGAVDHAVDAVHFNGRANFVGPVGMTGAFELWVTNDDALVPIAARFKVRIGSVKAELVKWKRGDWSPPGG